VRKGEAINERLAGVLSKLGVKAVEAGLSMQAVLDEGIIIVGDKLKLDIDGTRKSLEQSKAEAFALSVAIAYPTSESIVTLLQVAQQKAIALSIGAAVPTKETIGDLIRKAQSEMLSLNDVVQKISPKS
jgi:large subunit ribosomal protein L10